MGMRSADVPRMARLTSWFMLPTSLGDNTVVAILMVTSPARTWRARPSPSTRRSRNGVIQTYPIAGLRIGLRMRRQAVAAPAVRFVPAIDPGRKTLPLHSHGYIRFVRTEPELQRRHRSIEPHRHYPDRSRYGHH